MEAESGLGGEAGCLVEEVKVVQGELLLNGFCDFDGSLIFLSVAFFFSKLDETRTGLSFDL